MSNPIKDRLTLDNASRAKVELSSIQKRWAVRAANHGRGLCGCIMAETCDVKKAEAQGRSEGLLEAINFLVGAGL